MIVFIVFDTALTSYRDYIGVVYRRANMADVIMLALLLHDGRRRKKNLLIEEINILFSNPVDFPLFSQIFIFIFF